MAEEYLEDGFDPSTLKVAKLRGILFDNDVVFPSNAKKAELIDLFNKHVAVSSKEPGFVEEVNSGDEKEEKKPRKPRKSRKIYIEKNSDFEETESETSSLKIKQAIVTEDHERVGKKKKTRKPSKQIAKALAEEKIEEVESKVKEKENTKSANSSKLDGHEEKPIKTDISVSEISVDKNETKPEIEIVTETPRKSTENGNVSLSTSKLRKRKSMLEEVDLMISVTPSKGNIFDVDTDSEPELLSSRRKKHKHAADSFILSSPKSPFPKKAFSPNTSFTKNAIPAAANLTHESVAADEPLKLEKSNLRSPTQPKADKSETNIQAPVLEEIIYDPPSTETSTILSELTEEPSIWFKTQQSFEAPEPTPGDVFTGNSAASASQSFDSALSKLKRETHSEDILTPNEKKEELAKLLNIDVNSIKPKAKDRRSITPRRPIIIPQALLSRSSEKTSTKSEINQALEDELSSDEEEEDQSVDTILDFSEKKQPDLLKENSNKKSTKTQKKPPAARPSVLRAVTYFSLWLSLVGVLLFGYWYREQTFLVGYCGQEIYRKTIPDTPDTSRILVGLGDYLDTNYKPVCVECPQHARCFPRLEIACYDDFVVSAPWYYSYVPNFNLRAQKCIPDTKKAEKIEIMIDVALDLLRARNAHENCGRSEKDDVGAGLEVTELHDLLLALKAPYITEEEFEELWDRSVVELEKEPEIIVRYTNHLDAPAIDTNDTVTETHYASKVFRSTSLSHIGFKCMMSQTVVSLALRFKRTLAVIALLAIVVYASHWKYQQHKLYTHKVDTLYQEVLNKLRRQAKLGRGSSELPEFIGSVQLRDLILSSERNLAYKMRLWQAVSHKVDRNTNVKHELLEVHGEVMKVWQWISSVE